MEQQNFQNHVKVVPGFVFFVLPVLGLNLGWSLYTWWHSGFSFGGLVAVLLAAALMLGFFYVRTFALRVQDRVIRLEERLRYERVLPAELLTRAGELNISQIIALRFCSDAELPGLARKVLDQKLEDRKAIKRMVTEWRPDQMRT